MKNLVLALFLCLFLASCSQNDSSEKSTTSITQTNQTNSVTNQPNTSNNQGTENSNSQGSDNSGANNSGSQGTSGTQGADSSDTQGSDNSGSQGTSDNSGSDNSGTQGSDNSEISNNSGSNGSNGSQGSSGSSGNNNTPPSPPVFYSMPAKLIINLKGFDSTSGTEDRPSEISFNAGIGYSSKSWSTVDGGLKNGKNVFGTINKGDEYRLYTFQSGGKEFAQGEPQTCIKNVQLKSREFKVANGDDVVINMDCKTKATMQSRLSTTTTTSLEYRKGAKYPITKPTYKIQGVQRAIESDKFLYKINDESVASIDEKGIISLKKAGKFEVRVKADPNFYDASGEFVYKYEALVNESGIYLGDIELGQSSILNSDDNFLLLAGQKETVVRALVYSNKPNIKSPKITATFLTTNGLSVTKNMKCPSTLRVGEFTSPVYNLQDTCYLILKSEEDKKLVQTGVLINITMQTPNGEISKSVAPNITKPLILNIYVVRGKSARSTETLYANYPSDATQKIKEFLLATFPVSKVNIRLRKEPFDLHTNMYQALGEMDKIQKLETKNGEFAYAFVTQFRISGLDANQAIELNGNATGISQAGSGPSLGRSENVERDYIKVMAHELGHAFGLFHAPCGPGRNVDQVFDPFWKEKNPEPWYASSKGALSESPLYISQTQEVINPQKYIIAKEPHPIINSPVDLMGYCNGHRLSKHNYKFVLEKMIDHPYFKASSPANTAQMRALLKDTLIISGVIENDKIILNPSLQTSNKLPSQEVAPSNYSVIITSNGISTKYPLPLTPLDHVDETRFSLQIPVQKIEQIEFKKNNKPIDLEIKGLNADEQAQIFAPKKDVFKVSYENNIIKWNAKEYKFMTAVLHTFDDKNLIVSNPIGSQYNTGDLKAGFLEVVLSDGINTYKETFRVAP